MVARRSAEKSAIINAICSTAKCNQKRVTITDSLISLRQKKIDKSESPNNSKTDQKSTKEISENETAAERSYG
jgi:hypothetical protein